MAQTLHAAKAEARPRAALGPLLETLGWSRDHLAARLGCDARMLGKWEAGGFPQGITDWLRSSARSLTEDPPPDWRGTSASDERQAQPLSPCLKVLGWSRDRLADRLGCDVRTLGKWEARGFPPAVLAWLERRTKALADAPPPEWRTRRVADEE